MTTLALCTWIGLCVVASAIFSGSETGMYTLSRLRVEADAQRGSWRARLSERLLRDEAGLLVTILIGNNLMIELSAHWGEDLFEHLGVALSWREVVTTAVLTPFLFVFAELLPKDLFRRRPHGLVYATVGAMGVCKVLFLPLALPLRGLTYLAERGLGLDPGAQARFQGREAVLEMLRESEVAQAAHVEGMARNVLELRTIAVTRVMVPWGEVLKLSADGPPERLYEQIEGSEFSRLPVLSAAGPLLGYVHQLEVLASGPEVPLPGQLRPIFYLPPTTPLDRALVELRAAGQRMAIVGSAERPQGLLSLKDLVEEISGELTRW